MNLLKNQLKVEKLNNYIKMKISGNFQNIKKLNIIIIKEDIA